MPYEIERKFLVTNDSWNKLTTGIRYRQAYLSRTPERTVRVRVADGQGFLTIKGINAGARRVEFEYEIPLGDATVMIDTLCVAPVLEKDRYTLEYAGFRWEIDVFLGENQGLVVAEIELEQEEQYFSRPHWLGREVTGDARYYNSNLGVHPYSQWRDSTQEETT